MLGNNCLLLLHLFVSLASVSTEVSLQHFLYTVNWINIINMNNIFLQILFFRHKHCSKPRTQAQKRCTTEQAPQWQLCFRKKTTSLALHSLFIMVWLTRQDCINCWRRKEDLDLTTSEYLWEQGSVLLACYARCTRDKSLETKVTWYHPLPDTTLEM